MLAIWRESRQIVTMKRGSVSVRQTATQSSGGLVMGALDSMETLLNHSRSIYYPYINNNRSLGPYPCQWAGEGNNVWFLAQTFDASDDKSLRFRIVKAVLSVRYESTVAELTLNRNFSKDFMRQLDHDPFARELVGRLDDYMASRFVPTAPEERLIVPGWLPAVESMTRPSN